jgi:hypothetical protein
MNIALLIVEIYLLIGLSAALWFARREAWRFDKYSLLRTAIIVFGPLYIIFIFVRNVREDMRSGVETVKPKQRLKNRWSYLVGIIPLLLINVVIPYMRPLPEGSDTHSVIAAILSFGLLSFGAAWAFAWFCGFEAGRKEGAEDRG